MVQVNDVHLNTWMRSLEKKSRRHFFQSGQGTRWLQGVSTWVPIGSVQKYMRDKRAFSSSGGVYIVLATPRAKSILDYGATVRVAASLPSSACLVA